jgi:hypothetical protein
MTAMGPSVLKQECVMKPFADTSTRYAPSAAPNIPIQIQGDTAIMLNSDILPTNSFVDMNTTNWAYSEVFPTLSVP